MATLQEHRMRGTLGVARRTKFATFETVEDAIGGKEPIAALVFCDDPRGMTADFDNIGVGHGGSFTGLAGAPL